MGAVAYRNRLGEWTELKHVPSSECKNAFGQMLDQVATRGGLAITRHDTPRAVILSIEEFEALTRGREPVLETLSAELDALLLAMQAPGAKKARARAFSAGGGALGEAALTMAKKTAPAKRRAGKR